MIEPRCRMCSRGINLLPLSSWEDNGDCPITQLLPLEQLQQGQAL